LPEMKSLQGVMDMNVIDSFRLEGMVVVVTGAAGQVGDQLTKAYSEAGAHVVLADINAEECAKRAKTLSKSGKKCIGLAMDITDRRSVENALNAVLTGFGKVDVLVNNAGMGVFTPFETRSVDEFEKALKINLTGTFLCSQVFSSQMIKQKSGSIINIGSVYGVTTADYRIYGDSGRNSSEVYAATKAGVIHMTRYLAAYLARHGIRVNCISPGGLFNSQAPEFVKNYEYKTPMGRMADDTDLKGAAVFLASPAAKYVTGQNLVVDGGFTLL
jgi:NAD(P)-dependent dehydrogenase (short-subunit alcohol dehydrogenase family)